ncbi:hypothetical protein ATN89_18225 [Comamonas thiooxydans]|nr:hypothetical protein ATN89_18225 [Comamonas thiooxydans]
MLKTHRTTTAQQPRHPGSSLQTLQLRLTGNAAARFLLRTGSSDIVNRAKKKGAQAPLFLCKAAAPA